jgi:hypothetical protein
MAILAALLANSVIYLNPPTKRNVRISHENQRVKNQRARHGSRNEDRVLLGIHHSRNGDAEVRYRPCAAIVKSIILSTIIDIVTYPKNESSKHLDDNWISNHLRNHPRESDQNVHLNREYVSTSSFQLHFCSQIIRAHAIRLRDTPITLTCKSHPPN